MISCLKSWGLFKDELEEVKKEEKKRFRGGKSVFYKRKVVFK